VAAWGWDKYADQSTVAITARKTSNQRSEAGPKKQARLCEKKRSSSGVSAAKVGCVR